MKRLKAITATEMLLSIAIVGVIAALTLPILFNGYKKRMYETSIKKFYSTAKQAVTLYMAKISVTDLRATDLYGTSYASVSSNAALDYLNSFVVDYFHVAEFCDHQKNKCFANKYLALDGSDMSIDFRTATNLANRRDYMLPNGSVMRIGFSAEGPIEIMVDTNGTKAPNRAGHDLWAMNIYYDGTVDEVFVERGTTEVSSKRQELREQLYEAKCKKGSYIGCFGYALENNFVLNNI